MTNSEKIKNMSIEEMAIFLNKIATCCKQNRRYDKRLFCKECPLNCGNCSFVDFGYWLESEVEE